MTTSFICRRCIAQLSHAPLKRLRPKRRLHTPAGIASPPPATSWASFAETAPPSNLTNQSSHANQPHHGDEFGGEHEYSFNYGIGVPISPQGDNKLQPPRDNDPEEEILRQWDGILRKYIPRTRPRPLLTTERPNPASADELKTMILKDMSDYSGNYKTYLLGDLSRVYGLTRTEARHAVNQLERILWGRSWGDASMHLDVFLQWKTKHAGRLQEIKAINTHVYTHVKPHRDPSRVEQWTTLTREDSAIMKAAWQRLDHDKREILWPRMISSALRSNPGVVPTFIQATFGHSWCPNYLLEDVVYLLFRTLQSLRSLESGEHQLAELVVFLLAHCPPRYLSLHQVVLEKVISVLSTEELVNFYDTLGKAEHFIHANTLLHFASRFAKSSAHKPLAAKIVCSLTSNPHFDINAPPPASVCTSLLSLNEGESLPEGQAEPDELFKLLIDHGFRPNLLSLTALMRNFCLRGHLDTAWKIFDILLHHNFEPDPHVFTTLLNGSKQNFDIPSTQKIIETVFSRHAWSPVIVNEFLDFLHRENEAQPETRRRQKKDNSAWRPMLHLYSNFYDLAPLQKFVPFPLENVIARRATAPRYATPLTDLAAALRPQPEHMLYKPSSYTLIKLIAAHARSLDEPEAVLDQYKHVTRLMWTRDPLVFQLIKDQGTTLHDIYLRAMMQFEKTIHLPIRIVAQMLTRAREERQRTGRNTRHPPPSVHTWTVLLNGFKNHRLVQGALDVLSLMRRLGDIQPNLATWNALINAFARVGDAHGAVRAMRLLERAGFRSDERTIEAFNLLSRDRRELAVKLLEESRRESAGPPEQMRFPFTDDGPGIDENDGAIGEETEQQQQQQQPRPLGIANPAIAANQPLGFSSRPVVGPFTSPAFTRQIAEAQRRWDQHAAELKRRRAFNNIR